jgi:fucose 4-O-acetylase-like acetyltransferase
LSKRPILYDIKIATGIAIILVVIGHLASRGQEEIELYVKLKSIIYKFHMPLFLFLSGYIAYYTYPPIKSINDYYSYVKKKFIRLFPAYFIMSLVFFAGKYALGQSSEFVEGILNILFFPADSNSSFLWYIYVLFMFNLSMPIIDYFIKNKFEIFFAVSILLASLLEFPKLFSMNFYFWYLPFFTLGCYLSIHQEAYKALLKRYGLLTLVVFLIWSILEFFDVIDIHKNIVSLFAISGIGYLCSIKMVRNAFLEKMGDNSFYIYLFNTMFTGAISILLIKFFGKQSFYDNFYFLAPFLVLIGLYFPIILQKYIISKVPILKNLIR